MRQQSQNLAISASQCSANKDLFCERKILKIVFFSKGAYSKKSVFFKKNKIKKKMYKTSLSFIVVMENVERIGMLFIRSSNF